MSWVEKLTSVQARLVAGLALVTAITIGLAPDTDRPFDWEKAGAIAVAAIAWLFSEIAGERKPSAHDLALFDSITKHLPLSTLALLRDQDFGASFSSKPLSTLHDLAAEQGSRFRFQDEKLQTLWGALHHSMRLFSHEIAMNSWPIHGSASFCTVHPTLGDPDDPEPFVQKRIDSLNNNSTKLVRMIDDFEAIARQRLKL